MAISVAIVNQNTRDDLRACLHTVEAERPNNIIVVDNASTDGSVEMVQKEFPQVVLIARQDNPGYGAAANQAIAAAKSDFVLLLNSDTLLGTGALVSLTEYLARHPHAGVVGPRLLNPDGSLQHSCFPWPGAGAALFEEMVGSRKIIGIPVLRERYWRTWSHDRPRKAPWVLGAALAIRRDAFEEVGGFDPSFFMYFEETDLCRRMWEAGWEVHFTPVAEIEHIGGVSTDQRRVAMYARLYQSMLRFVEKHEGPGAARRLRGVLRAAMRLRLMRDDLRLRLYRADRESDVLVDAVARWRAVLAVL